MSKSEKDVNQTEEVSAEEQELIELRRRAIGIGMVVNKDFYMSAKKEKLLENIAAYEERLANEFKAQQLEAVALAPRPLPDDLQVTAPDNESENARRTRLRNAASRLQRITIVCNNKDKSEWSGEVLTFSNSLIGTIKKYVPFNNAVPYHVPKCLVDFLQERKMTVFETVFDKHGNPSKRGIQTNEFNIVIHPDLTKEEHDELRKTQLLAKGQLDD